MASTSPILQHSQFSEYLDQLVNEDGAAAFLGYTIRALQNWRLRGGGPRFVKVSGRSIRYRRRDLIEWIEQKLRTSSADPGPAPSNRSEPAAVLAPKAH